MESERQTFSAYRQFMGDLVGNWEGFHTFQEPSEELLKKYRARMLSKAELKKRTRSSEPMLTFVGFGVTMGAYEVDLGPFRFEINLLRVGG